MSGCSIKCTVRKEDDYKKQTNNQNNIAYSFGFVKGTNLITTEYKNPYGIHFCDHKVSCALYPYYDSILIEANIAS